MTDKKHILGNAKSSKKNGGSRNKITIKNHMAPTCKCGVRMIYADEIKNGRCRKCYTEFDGMIILDSLDGSIDGSFDFI